ncbi:hypothetical protein FB451DRAFT_1559106 [Mycena latifolia]|nr:hypothetical protein FB451DRAFT_1559106 [Mycena latifolia]
MSLDRSTVFRIISLSIAGGDVLQTIPGTYAMYKRQWDRRRLSAVCFFYAMARYMSVFSLVANGFNAFYKGYTPTTCKRIYMFPNVTALLAGMAVQVLVYIRTYAISGRSKYVRFGLGSILLLGFPVQIFGIVYHVCCFATRYVLTVYSYIAYVFYSEIHLLKTERACKGKVLHPGEPDWNIVYYSAHMVFDVIACATATYYLVYSSRVLGVLHFSKLLRHVLRDGLLYFLVVFLVNLWVVLEFAHVFVSGAASSLPLAVVLIAVQHLTLSTQRMTKPGGRRSSDDFTQSISQGPPRFSARNQNRRQLDVELQSGDFDTILESSDLKGSLHSQPADNSRTLHSSGATASTQHNVA